MAKLSIDSKKLSDTGQVLTLVCILVFLFTSYQYWLIIALLVLVVNMTCSVCLMPIAYLWFGLAEILGSIVSRVVLTLVFFTLVVPVGFIRYCCGADPMRLKDWKSPRRTERGKRKEERECVDSVFVERNHLYVSQDIVSPF